jgi:hypothetical protein
MMHLVSTYMSAIQCSVDIASSYNSSVVPDKGLVVMVACYGIGIAKFVDRMHVCLQGVAGV